MTFLLDDGILEVKLGPIFVKYSVNISQIDFFLVISELLFLKQGETVPLSLLFVANWIVYQMFLELFNVLSSLYASTVNMLIELGQLGKQLSSRLCLNVRLFPILEI